MSAALWSLKLFARETKQRTPCTEIHVPVYDYLT